MREKDGRYVATKYFNFCGTLIKGFGFTIEEARKDLKAAIKAYREHLNGGKYMKGVVDEDGKVGSLARPDLAHFLSVQNSKKRS